MADSCSAREDLVHADELEALVDSVISGESESKIRQLALDTGVCPDCLETLARLYGSRANVLPRLVPRQFDLAAAFLAGAAAGLKVKA